MFGLISTIALISVGCLLVLPWIRTFEKGGNKTISIIFISLIVLCTILWIICVYLGINLYKNTKTNIANIGSLVLTLRFIKVTTIITLQIFVSSLIANTIIRYKKEMIAFQVITYASNLFFDFYVTCLLLCLRITPQEGLQIAKAIKFLFTKFMFVLFLLSIVYMSLSSKIMKTIDARRFKNAVEDYNSTSTQPEQPTVQTTEQPAEKSKTTAEERLQKLQSMLEKKLITQEEFNKKREEIIKDL